MRGPYRRLMQNLKDCILVSNSVKCNSFTIELMVNFNFFGKSAIPSSRLSPMLMLSFCCRDGRATSFITSGQFGGCYHEGTCEAPRTPLLSGLLESYVWWKMNLWFKIFFFVVLKSKCLESIIAYFLWSLFVFPKSSWAFMFHAFYYWIPWQTRMDRYLHC